MQMTPYKPWHLWIDVYYESKQVRCIGSILASDCHEASRGQCEVGEQRVYDEAHRERTVIEITTSCPRPRLNTSSKRRKTPLDRDQTYDQS